MTPLAWLTTPAVEATAKSVKATIEKLEWLRGTERRRFPATVGRRSTNEALRSRASVSDPVGGGGAVGGGPAG